MLDPKLLRNDLQPTLNRLSGRKFTLDTAHLKQLELQRYDLQLKVQTLQSERNAKSREVGMAKSSNQFCDTLMDRLRLVSDELTKLEQALQTVQEALQAIYLTIPNIPHDSVPAGQTEEDNVTIRHWGKPTEFDVSPKDHIALTQKSGQMDFTNAAKLAGSRFVVLQRPYCSLTPCAGAIYAGLPHPNISLSRGMRAFYGIQSSNGGNRPAPKI